MPWRYINAEVIHRYPWNQLVAYNHWTGMSGPEWRNEPPLLCLADQRSHTPINFVNGVNETSTIPVHSFQSSDCRLPGGSMGIYVSS